MSMKRVGKVLWWSSRDENGVISDSQGNEYYFDKSVIAPKIINKLERGALVYFESSRCDSILVAKSIGVPTGRSVARYEEQFKFEQRQLKLPIAV